MLPPPMTHSWSGGVPAVASRMAARLETVSAPSREKSGQWVMTMFRRLGRGRPPGKESSVRRPRMTVPPRVRERNRFMSVGREKSRSLSRPMAQF